MIGGVDNSHDHGKYGKDFMQQAWRIEGCSFRREQDLPFKFDSGRCTTMMGATQAMLCAGIQRPRTCYTYDLDFDATDNL